MKSLLHRFGLAALLVGAGPALAEELQFNRDIRPILSENCFHCHGPSVEGRKAGLRLDTADGAYLDNKGVRAIVPGDPKASEAMHRIWSTDPDDMMPPPKSNLAEESPKVSLRAAKIASLIA